MEKQEILEEHANKANGYNVYAKETKAPIFNEGFIEGAKWQAERMYSEEDVKNAFLDGWQLRNGDLPFPKAKKSWFNKFKKE